MQPNKRREDRRQKRSREETPRERDNVHYDDIRSDQPRRRRRLVETFNADTSNFRLLQLIIAKGYGGRKKPFLVWGKYHGPDGNLTSVDALQITKHTGSNERKYLYSALTDNFPELDIRNSSLLSMTNVYHLRCGDIVRGIENHIDTRYFPDLILRRVAATNCPRLNDQDFGYPSNMKKLRQQRRCGVNFGDTIESNQPESYFQPEIDFTSDIQETGLTQEEINRVVRISKNYVPYCHERRIPSIWPELGQFRDWPPEFLQFEHKKSFYADIYWIGKDVRFTSSGGFPCDLDSLKRCDTFDPQ